MYITLRKTDALLTSVSLTDIESAEWLLWTSVVALHTHTSE